MRKRMSGSVLPLVSVTPMLMVAPLTLSVGLERPSNQLQNLLNLTVLFGSLVAHDLLPQNKRRRKRRKTEAAGQRVALLEGRGKRVQRRRNTGQSLSPRNGSIDRLLQRANANLRTRNENGLEVHHLLQRAAGVIVQPQLTPPHRLTPPVVGLEVLRLNPVQPP